MRKGYFHSTTLMHSFRTGFSRPRQKIALIGRGLEFALLGLRAAVRLFAACAAADMVATAPVAASAVFQAELSGLWSGTGAVGASVGATVGAGVGVEGWGEDSAMWTLRRAGEVGLPGLGDLSSELLLDWRWCGGWG